MAPEERPAPEGDVFEAGIRRMKARQPLHPAAAFRHGNPWFLRQQTLSFLKFGDDCVVAFTKLFLATA